MPGVRAAEADRALAEVVTEVHERTTDLRHDQPVSPNVLERNFSPGQPNSTWTTDISYVATR
ncbi:hypothetical protein JQX13_31475 [Archangium violaceum]|nr:hypothetical protein [Archangium violaceum]QRK14236.1 hypothetical protein JQX13_31475 [Archangium violaceum]